MKTNILFASLFILSVSVVNASKILIVFPIPSFSHFIVCSRLAKELANRGHEVTVISPYPEKDPIKNYRDISIEEVIQFVDDLKEKLFEVGFGSKGVGGAMANIMLPLEMGIGITNRTLSHPSVQKLINSQEHFDLVILEPFLNDGLVSLAHHFKAPIIYMSSLGPSSFNNHLFVNPAPSSYVPNLNSEFSTHMDFWQRLNNLFINLAVDVVREFLLLPEHRKIFKQYTKTDLELDDVLYNGSLLLTNSHPSIGDALPHLPSVIGVGGIHIGTPKQLPEDLQIFLDNAKDGAIIFSMGSNLRSKDLSEEVRKGILKAFSKIKQKVLWKFEEDLPEAPANVKIMKWLPQQSILAHPNVKAFISHGGLLSTIETIYFGVPIIGIPVFGDQRSNIASAVNNGYAVRVDLNDLSEEKLSWALNEILNNTKYYENVKIRSKLFHDRPLKPLDTAVYWVEYVIRHKGAPHLRPASLDLKWYQRQMVDVFVFLTLVTITIFAVMYIIFRKLLRILNKYIIHTSMSKNKKDN